MSWLKKAWQTVDVQKSDDRSANPLRAVDAQLREQIRSTKVEGTSIKKWDEIFGLDQTKQVPLHLLYTT